MIYDPNNPLTDEQLEQLGKDDFDAMLEYLDGITAHLSRKGNPKVKEHKEQKRQVLRNCIYTRNQILKDFQVGNWNTSRCNRTSGNLFMWRLWRD